MGYTLKEVLTMQYFGRNEGRRAQNARIVALALVLTASVACGIAQRLYWLGSVGGDFGVVYSIADNGVAVGFVKDASYTDKAFVWDRVNGLRLLPTLGGAFAAAEYCSPDGSLIAGYAANSGGTQRAVIWRTSDGVNYTVTDLGTLGGSTGAALGISPDGRFVTGWMSTATGSLQAFLYDVQNGTRIGLGTLGGTNSIGRRVTIANNVIIVSGSAQISGNLYRPFRWTSDTNQMQYLGDPFGQGGNSYVYGMSLDGQTIVGEAPIGSNRYAAYRWQSGSFTRIDGSPNFSYGSAAINVSADGSIVVGLGRNSLGWASAWRWREGVGTENLNEVYRDLLGASFLTIARAISPNGRYIGGFGYNAATYRYEPFVLDTQGCVAHNGDVDENRCVDDADLLAVLFAFGQTGSELGRVDVNCDGVVDDADLLQVLFNFGSGC
jgi:probable HAF family extracellular repeat protein